MSHENGHEPARLRTLLFHPTQQDSEHCLIRAQVFLKLIWPAAPISIKKNSQIGGHPPSQQNISLPSSQTSLKWDFQTEFFKIIYQNPLL